MEDRFVFIDSNLPMNSFRTFDNMRAEGFLCDVTFKIGDRKVSAHRSLLAASSPYFRSMFLSMKNGHLEDLTIPEVEPDALEVLINFSYKCRIEITSDNVRPVLSGSHFLQMDHVYDACCDFYSRTMLPNSVLEIRAFATSNEFQKLKKIASDYVQRYFVQVSRSEGFLDLSFTDVKELITTDNLHVVSEEVVFQAVMAWVKKSIASREDKLPELLRCVNMPLLSSDHLMRVVSEELIKKSKSCQSLLDEAMSYNMLHEDTPESGSFMTTPRHFIRTASQLDKTEEFLFSVGGNIEACSLTLKYCVPRIGRWMGALEVGTVYAGDAAIVAMGKKLYVIGGCDVMGNALDIVQVFDTETATWGRTPPMNVKRYNATATVFSNKIYVFGGITGYSEDMILCSVEYFCPETNRWTYVPQMCEHRLGACAVALGEHIYVLGGCGGNSDITDPNDLKSVGRFDPGTRNWTNVSEMTGVLCLRGAAALHGKIFVHGEKYLEVYDPLSGKWHRISHVRHHKSGFSLLPVGGKLFAIGGKAHPADDTPFAVDIYDPTTDEWSEGTPLPEYACFLGAAHVFRS